MDPESVAFQPREDFWRFQSDMLRVQQNQAELSERVARLERKQEEDLRLKNVWGTSSPFPSVLGGTPQQVPLQQPTAEHFSNFDDHSSNLIGNLQLDTDDEPRRIGTTSRANSVRFDETANHGHWAHASRSSLDLIPRTGSGMGGHLMSERSYSHKSDGRQSSTGHSVHSMTSGRANSLTSYGPNSAIEPPGLAPGLFILGSVPAIIRCWLNTDFKNDTLLYAAVCSGSYSSYLDLHLIERLGFQEQITMNDDGVRKIKLPVYLPEAVPVSASSRSSSPAPQLPSLSVNFIVVEDHDQEVNPKAIQVFLGSDMMRLYNADILFSSNQLTLYDDERTKLQIPMVRPEDDRAFKSMFISHGPRNSTKLQHLAEASVLGLSEVGTAGDVASSTSSQERPSAIAAKLNGARTTVSSDDDGSSGRGSLEQRSYHATASDADHKEVQDATSAPRTGSAFWNNWRREAEKPPSMDWASVGKTSSSGPGPTYQRRETGIKVLKPSKPGLRSLSTSIAQPSPSTSAAQSRFFDDGKRRGSTAEGEPSTAATMKTLPQLKRSISGEKARENGPGATKTRTSNPVGGASAFPWLNSGKSK